MQAAKGGEQSVAQPSWKCTHELSAMWFPEQDQNNDKSSWHVNVHKETQYGPNPTWRVTGSQWPLRGGESVASRDKLLYRLFNPNSSVMDTCKYKQNSTESVGYIHVCIYTHTYVYTCKKQYPKKIINLGWWMWKELEGERER